MKKILILMVLLCISLVSASYNVGTLNESNYLALYLPFDNNISSMWSSRINALSTSNTRNTQPNLTISTNMGLATDGNFATSETSLITGDLYFDKYASDTGMTTEIRVVSYLDNGNCGAQTWSNITIPSDCFSRYTNYIHLQANFPYEWTLSCEGTTYIELLRLDRSAFYCSDPKVVLYEIYGHITNQTNFTAYSQSIVGSTLFTNDVSTNGNFSVNLINEINKSIYLNGSAYLNITNSSLNNISSDRSVCSWVKPTVFNAREVLFSYGTNTTSNQFNLAINGTGDLVFDAFNSTGVVYSGFFSLNNWTHVCLTYNNNISYVYRNGVLVNTSRITLNTTDLTVNVGRDTGANKYYFSGYLDSLMFFNTRLSLSNVKTLYNGYNSSVTFNVFDEVTKLLVPQILTFDVISDNLSAQYTGESNPVFVNSINPGLSTIRYSADGYPERFYFLNITNNSTNTVNLYSLSNNESTNITSTVYNNNNDPLENAYVHYQRYFPANNTYVTVSMGRTSALGVTIQPLQFNTEFYKALVFYPYGVLLQETNPAYIQSVSPLFQVNTIALPGVYFNLTNGIVTTGVQFNNVSNTFIYTFSSVSGINSNSTLKVYENTIRGQTLLNSTSVIASGGTLMIPVAGTNGTTYSALAVVTYTGNLLYPSIVGARTVTIPSSTPGTGLEGLFGAVLLTIAVMFVGYFSLKLMVVLVPLPVLLFAIMGLISFDVYILASIELAAIILAIFIRF